MPKVRRVLGACTVEIAQRRRICHRDRKNHSIPKGAAWSSRMRRLPAARATARSAHSPSSTRQTMTFRHCGRDSHESPRGTARCRLAPPAAGGGRLTLARQVVELPGQRVATARQHGAVAILARFRYLDGGHGGGQLPRHLPVQLARAPRPAARDSVIALVLSVHAEADRSLGFEQVVELSGNRVTRAQVSAASAALCRGGQLDRIRSGVYQWSAGQRAARRLPSARRADVRPPESTAIRPGSVSAASCSASSSPPGSR